MKKYILDKAIKLIKKNNPTISQIELDKIKYGLEGIYLSITKFIVISAFAIYLNIFKEFLFFTFCYNLIRVFAFGLHAPNSYTCFIMSTIIFLLLPYLATIIYTPFYIKLIICILLFILIMIYAPADTHKRPLIKKHKRNKWKILSLIITSIYVFIILFMSNHFITNILLFALSFETILILPITYKIFKVPYRNYLSYHQRS